MALVILYYFLIAIMIVGIIGELLPAVPGMSLILIAMLVWGFVTKFCDYFPIHWRDILTICYLFLYLYFWFFDFGFFDLD